MSDSPNLSRSQKTVGPMMVAPQLVTDPTILDSVAGFINEVVPTTHNSPQDTKDQIQWAHFEQLDGDEPPILCDNEYEELAPADVILVLGYITGVQVWVIPSNGEATEILSWRHGSPRIVKFLPTPFVVNNNKTDIFASKRPLLGLCDNTSSGPHFSTLNFISLKTGEQAKVSKFKNAVIGVVANRRSVVVTFQEKFAVLDAFTLEHLFTVSSCYLSPSFNPNPVALGSRWLAYADKKLNTSKKSSGGNDGEGVQSYTATVLHAAKSLSRGLREFSETVASSLTGSASFKPGTSPNSPQAGGTCDVPQKGVVTILDIENPSAQSLDKSPVTNDPIVAHFMAHTEAIVYLKFDPSGMLLFTADKRGHDFHIFRIFPHPGGPALAAAHHLYTLHRGDTSARVQDACFAADARWAAVSTVRGTTHVFPVTPYGGPASTRTHAAPHVVNRLSRFHRSAGLTMDGRSNSPVSMFEVPANSSVPYHNPRFPPYPHPTVVQPLAQIKHPAYVQSAGVTPQRSHSGRQRLSSSSDETVAESVVACFARPRAWLDTPSRDLAHNKQPKPVESLLVMSWHGVLVQYDLDPHQITSIPRERLSGDSPIELSVCAKAQWLLRRRPGWADVAPPLPPASLAHLERKAPPGGRRRAPPNHGDDQWLAQVEIVTHAGPHRRLWMGPQFTFKTYTTASWSLAEAKPIDLGRTKPVNMPKATANAAAVLIESTSASSYEQPPLETYHRAAVEGVGVWETQLKEDLADAMLESPGARDGGGHCVIVQMKPVAKVVNPLGTVVTVQSDEETEVEVCEEIIHENCDESLFRPFVPSRVYCSEGGCRFGDSIITKSLQGNTEVAVNILTKPEPPPLNEDFFSLEIPKAKPKSSLLEDSYETNTSEENVFEEKSISKRPRRPKAKLGVKIVNMDKEREKTFEDVSVEIAPSAKKSWSCIASSKPARDRAAEYGGWGVELPKIEFEEDFGFRQPERCCGLSESKGLLSVSADMGLLKIDKSSDDEKGESSSPLDTTESDDSGKVLEQASVFEDPAEFKAAVTVNKSSRRRKKKK